MISNLHIGVDGRLGNQLFQYAALKSLALNNGYECVLPPLNPRVWHGQPCMLSEFNLECKFLEKIAVTQQYEEQSIIDFDENFFNIEDGTAIRGFFQNTKYFENFETQISKELRTNDILQERAEQILSYYKNQFPDYEFVSIHIRRGDNITVNVEFGKQLFGENSYLLDKESMYGKYIYSAIDKFKDKKVKFFVFTGGNRDNNDEADNEWVKRNFGSNDFITLNTNDALLDYTLISNCDHNILCHVTSFGWWAAYVNQNPNKIMIAPKNYFVDGTDASRMFNDKFTLL